MVCLPLLVAWPTEASEEAAWRALAEGGYVVLIRHTDAPGPPGDPPGFKLDDCSTQRNLSEAGRNNASAIGVALRAHQVSVERVLSSAWCRCRDTAKLMGFGEPEVFPPLNNVYGRGGMTDDQRESLRAAITSWKGRGNLVMVSHGVVIGPLTGIYPGEGDVIVLKPRPGQSQGFEVVGRIPRGR